MSDSDKSGSLFWSALDNILRSRPTSAQTDNELRQDKKTEPAFKSGEDVASSEEIFKCLNGLKPSEKFENRLKSFEDLIKLSELFQLDENLVNIFLKSTSDLYKIDQTPAEIRIMSFKYLIKFYEKKSDKFDSFMLKNHLLCFIIINCKKSKCIFLNALNQISKPTSPNDAQDSISTNLKPINSPKVISDDIKLRLSLFLLVTKNGNYCNNLDPDLMSECLVYFLEKSEFLIDKIGDLFVMFKNLMTNKFFQYMNEQILTMLSRTILYFSYLVTANFERGSQMHLEDINSCVDLINYLIDNITSSVCINYVVLCLCELLDIVWQNSLTKSAVQINRSDYQTLDSSDLLIDHIYGCMSKLFVSPIASYAVFTFFSEIFPISKKYQVHRKHQINGALMHIKKIFDEFKQSKSKNIYLIKELHLNCLIYLPNALKSCCTDGPREQQLIIFKHILNLTIDLVHLSSHRDLFMCLLTYNSRRFLIEIVNQFSLQNLEDGELIKKYADLINLLDVKDVFSYKTSQKEPSSGQVLLRNPSSVSLNSDNLEELSLIMFKFKESFYDLVYKFPQPNYLKDNCINNCIDFYLHRKFLPIFGPQSIEGIKRLLEKYLGVRNEFSIVVRKNLIETLHRKIKDYFQMDHKIFIEQLIEQVLIQAYEITLVEDDSHFRSVSNAGNIFDLFEMKYFIVSKLVDLVVISNDENNVFKIIKIFEKIIEMEKVSSVEMLVPHRLVSSNMPNVSQMTIHSNNQLFLIYPNGNASNCLSYLSKIITQGLVETFEKNFQMEKNRFSSCSIEIFNILVKYIEYYYLTQYSFNSANLLLTNNPNTLSSMAAESLPLQNQIGAQSSSKFFNYYSHIRKEIFEFILRIRSDSQGRVLLIERINRHKKKSIENLSETRHRLSEDYELKKLRKCEIDFGKILKLIEYCLDKELDWHVITRLLSELPYVLQYEMDLIKTSDFTYRLFNLLDKKDINLIRNKPENLSKQEYISKFYPLLASLVLYHSTFEKNSQENILQNLASGIHANRNLYCLEILTIAMTEMNETNSIQCADLLLKLSQISSSITIAQPILELLSTISDFKKLHSICGTKEFIAVSATAIKYIDPFKFNPFIVLMAHYVLCAWFIKCKPESRKSYASFTSKGLYQEVIVQLDSQANLREKKSPNKSPEQENLTNAQKRLSSADSSQKNESKSSQSESYGTSRTISDNLKKFYRDLVEITMDFMSNNMNYDSSYLNQSSSVHNSGEYIADRFSNIGTLNGNNNQTGPFENKENKKSGQQTKLWLIGNKIIQITTGLFSNVCVEQEPIATIAKQRNSKNCSKSKEVQSQAIDIPSRTEFSVENIASSNSSTSVSVSSNSNFADSRKSESNLPQVCDKSDQDLFDETIEASDSSENKKELPKPSILKSNQNELKRNRCVKRRYKSGLPSTDRNDGDSTEENFLKSINDSSYKLSKDDSVLNIDTNQLLPFCCIKNGNDINHYHHHHNTSSKGSELNELCNPNCWCNNLVEIKCRYPTKVASFVTLIEPNFSNFHSINLTNFDKILKSHPFDLSPEEKTIKQSAVELRRLTMLARISESSAGNETPPNEKLELNIDKRPNIPRKSSLEVQVESESNIFLSMRNQRNFSAKQGIDPSQVFLHLFQNNHFVNDVDQPMLIPDNDAIKRSLNILDYYSCFWLHKIGVVYIGQNQAHDEKAILSNSSGSLRYRTFVNSLGNLICLRDMDTDLFYPGGLDTDGTVGDFAVIWFDGIIQVLFHVCTLMLTEENTNSKKRHIGNDFTIIVYNESGEEYNFSMIKGEVNCVCIEIIPLKANTNIVKVKTTNEMSQWLTYSDPKFVSDQNLGLIVRKMALHADIASKVFRSQKDGVNFYGGRFYERLKQIKRILKQTKENHKFQTSAKSINESKTSSTNNSDKISSQMDFFEYI